MLIKEMRLTSGTTKGPTETAGPSDQIQRMAILSDLDEDVITRLPE